MKEKLRLRALQKDAVDEHSEEEKTLKSREKALLEQL